MTFVVAGVVLALSFIVGMTSFIVAPRFNLISDEKAEGGDVKSKASPAMAIAEMFKRAKWKQWIIIVFGSLLCAICAWLMLEANAKAIDICKYIFMSLALMSVMIIDGKTHRIPNQIVAIMFGGGVVFLIWELVMLRKEAVGKILMHIIGLIGCLLLFYIMARLTKDGMGMGDVKLIAVTGWVLGISQTLITILFALIICTIIALFLLVGKKKSKKDQIPFGPFMFFGYIVMLLLFGF